MGAVSLGRYTLHAELASGGMASVHLGRLAGDAGFGRTVAIKRLHPQYAKDPDFVRMFLDEARLAARIHHPNVVPTLDVVAESGELFLVLEYVRGESLSTLARTLHAQGEKMPIPVATSIIVGALNGLEAAHDARDARGEPLHIIHRDISPQNVMVGADGVARLLDFGVAKARARLSTTLDGHLKGKIAYMAPEQLRGDVSQQSDVYAVGVVLWELLTGRRLFSADNETQLMVLVERGDIAPPSAFHAGVPAELDRICARALARDPNYRYPSAIAMAQDLDRSTEVASSMRVTEWMNKVAGPALEAQSKRVADLESGFKEASREAFEVLSRGSVPPSIEEAANKAVATVSSFAKAADQVVRSRARRMADKAARDVGALATAFKVPPSNPVLKAALAPLVGKQREPDEKTPDPEQTRAARPPKRK